MWGREMIGLSAHPLETAVTLAAPAVGPVVISLLGYDVPILAAALSLIGVVLASLIAPPPPRALNNVQHVALVGLLCIITLALVISDPARNLIVSTCWAIGIGYTGLPIIHEIQRRIFARASDLTGELTDSQKPEEPSDV